MRSWQLRLQPPTNTTALSTQGWVAEAGTLPRSQQHHQMEKNGDLRRFKAQDLTLHKPVHPQIFTYIMKIRRGGEMFP